MAELKLQNIKYTLAEYLAIDAQSEDRYEYENGYIWAMAGTTTNHNLIVQNLTISFRAFIKMKGSKCRIFTESVRLEVANKKIYYYPDLIFTCNPADLQEKMMIHSPILIIEVLSEGSFSMDLLHKFDNYTKMPSLLYYIAISQDEYRLRVWERNAGKWQYSSYEEITDIVDLPQIEMILALTEVYENIEFESSNVEE